jgi:hypothetical protein
MVCLYSDLVVSISLKYIFACSDFAYYKFLHLKFQKQITKTVGTVGIQGFIFITKIYNAKVSEMCEYLPTFQLYFIFT